MAAPYNFIISGIVTIGLIVLTALHDTSANVTIPVLIGLAGVHTGAQISSPTVVPSPPAPTPPSGSAAATGGQLDIPA